MAAKRTCTANVGSRANPRACGQSTAPNMLAACDEHKLALIPTGESAIYYSGGSYAVVTRHRGRQVKTFHRTLSQAREAGGDRTGTGRQARQTRRPFDKYALEWVQSCQGRTARGFDEHTRTSYQRALELHAIPTSAAHRYATSTATGSTP